MVSSSGLIWKTLSSPLDGFPRVRQEQNTWREKLNMNAGPRQSAPNGEGIQGEFLNGGNVRNVGAVIGPWLRYHLNQRQKGEDILFVQQLMMTLWYVYNINQLIADIFSSLFRTTYLIHIFFFSQGDPRMCGFTRWIDMVSIQNDPEGLILEPETTTEYMQRKEVASQRQRRGP